MSDHAVYAKVFTYLSGRKHVTEVYRTSIVIGETDLAAWRDKHDAYFRQRGKAVADHAGSALESVDILLFLTYKDRVMFTVSFTNDIGKSCCGGGSLPVHSTKPGFVSESVWRGGYCPLIGSKYSPVYCEPTTYYAFAESGRVPTGLETLHYVGLYRGRILCGVSIQDHRTIVGPNDRRMW